MKRDKTVLIAILVVITAIVGSKMTWDSSFTNDPTPKRIKVKSKKISVKPTGYTKKITEAAPKYVLEEVQPKKKILLGERMLHFNNKEEMDAFLKNAQANGLKITRIIPALNMIRVRFTKRISRNEFLARFGEVSVISENSPIGVPEPILSGGSIGFRSHPLNFLGITDNADWGKGVTVAVIDSGVVKHPALKGNISHFDLINDGSVITSNHGTSVASLITGDSALIKGVAPAANLIDIRALNNDGSGDAFTVAEGIVLAVDNGAQVINLSLGSPSDNPALRQAVLYAQSKGVILVAAVGNEGAGRVSYPASYPGVIGVGSNDADENYLSFSNRGSEVDISAPGIELTAAGVNDDVILFTGTSASSPLVAATIAFELAQYPDLSQDEIISRLLNSANDNGPPGEDNLFGDGILNVGRLEANSEVESHDAAAAGFHLEQLANSDKLKLFFSGENRGTEVLTQVEMTLSYPGFEQTYTFKDIASSQTFFDTVTVDLNSPVIQEGQEILLTIKSVNDEADFKNNVKSVKIRLNKQ